MFVKKSIDMNVIHSSGNCDYVDLKFFFEIEVFFYFVSDNYFSLSKSIVVSD